MRPDRGSPPRGLRASRRPRRAGRGLRQRSGRAASRRSGGPALPGFASLDELLAGSDADVVVLATPSGLHATQTIQAAVGGPSRRDREADGHAMEGRHRDGAGLRQGRGPALRGQAESPEPHDPAGQAGDRQGTFRPDLPGDGQRPLEPAPVVLRQRVVARHLGVRRRRLHEPGQPLRRPARLADRPGADDQRLHRHAGAEHPGGGHRGRRDPAGAPARSVPSTSPC